MDHHLSFGTKSVDNTPFELPLRQLYKHATHLQEGCLGYSTFLQKMWTSPQNAHPTLGTPEISIQSDVHHRVVEQTVKTGTV